ANDLGRKLARKHGIGIYDSVAGALTCGGKELAVQGVLVIGEHGSYPTNALGQTLYPRRKWLEETFAIIERSGRPVPVFNDKHLAQSWPDARWIHERARARRVPLMAGSVVPLSWRVPEVTVPRGAEVSEALAIGYGQLEGYGFHSLEFLQAMVERRKGGETGVKAIQCLQGAAMWQALDAGRWSKDLLTAALKLLQRHHPGDMREVTARAPDAAL